MVNRAHKENQYTHCLTIHVLVSCCLNGFLLFSAPPCLFAFQSSPTTFIRIDASKRLNHISALLYGHFAEFMFEDIKGGLWAELLQNRGFENSAPRPSVAHYWERYPDNRNDDFAMIFGGEHFGIEESGYPPTFRNHSQLLICTSEDRQPRGMYQSNMPVRAISYGGSVWLRASAVNPSERKLDPGTPFSGYIRVSLEENTPGGKIYAQQDLTGIAG